MYKPVLSLKDAQLAEGPILIERNSQYYVRYRHQLKTNDLNLYQVTHAKKINDAVYFFFMGKLSFEEYGSLKEIPLAGYGREFVECAKAGHVFWLDPDGTRHLISLHHENQR